MKKIFWLFMAVSVAQSHLAWAQFDDEDLPPPPGAGIPAPARRTTESPMGGASGKSAADSSAGVMSKQQKEKFAKAGIEDINNENFPETIDSFDFPDANITDIVKAISELTGKNFIVDSGVRGKITIIAPSKITVAEAYKAFLSALAVNGFAIVPSGGFLKIRNARNAQRDSIETYSGAYYPNSDQMITRIIHLKHISAEMVNRDLRILSSKDGEMVVYPQTNSIIISDYGSNIDRVMKILNQLDVPGFDDQLEVVPVKYAKAKDIADVIDKIVNKGSGNRSGNAGAFTSGVPRFTRGGGSQGQSGSAYYMVIPDDRTNSLIVTGNKVGIEKIKKLLTQLDFRIRPEDTGGVYVYYVKNGDAEKIATTLAGIAKEASPKPATGGGASAAPAISPTAGVQTTQEIFGGDVKITADKGTNSLVILASKQDYEVVLNLLNKIDIPRDQVYVESVIMEMKITDAMNYSIGYFKYDDSGTGVKAGFNGFKNTGLADMLNPISGAGTIIPFGDSSKTVEIKPLTGGSTIKVPSLVGFINFLKSNTNANILSTPQLMAMDNQEALIEVGDKVVTGVKTTLGTGTTPSQSEPIFEEAKISLKLKPFISPTSNSVRMELETSVTQPSTARTPDALLASTQPLATRKVKTNIVIRNGDTAILGGLMKEDDKEEIQKVPLLGDIPIIGWLFKSRQASKEKTNMLIFLTPKIVRTGKDGTKLLGEKMDERLDFIKSVGGRDPYGSTVDKIQKRAANNQEGVESSK